jgi:hypothetical protein
MAQGSKGAARHAPSAPNGPSTPSSTSAVSSGPAVNRKKQKRRQKQAAKDAGSQQQPPPSDDAQFHSPQDAPHYQEFDDDDSDYAYGAYLGSPDQVNGHVNGHASTADTNKKSKKKKGKPAPAEAPRYPTDGAAATARLLEENLWNLTKSEESEQIKVFWESLTYPERKALLVVEKNSVLKTMRETSQKQTCSCTICGRRRSAIEAELELLYEQYFHELQEYAKDAARNPAKPGLPPPCLIEVNQRTSRFPNIIPSPGNGVLPADDYDEDEDDYCDDGYQEALRGPSGYNVASEMFHLGQNLAVKGKSAMLLLQTLTGADGILTVADDLLKNEGKRFIDMMEQLAERRLAREEAAQHAHHHGPPQQGQHGQHGKQAQHAQHRPHAPYGQHGKHAQHSQHDSAYATSHEDHLEDDEPMDDDEAYAEDEEGDDEDDDEDEASAPCMSCCC